MPGPSKYISLDPTTGVQREYVGGGANGLAPVDAAGRLPLANTPIRRAQFIKAMSALLTGGVTAFVNAGWILASQDDPSNIAWFHEPFVDPAGTLAGIVSNYLQAATNATPPGLGMGSTAAATQMAALFANAATQGN